MKIKRVSKTPVPVGKKVPDVPLGPQRPRLARQMGKGELDELGNPIPKGPPPQSKHPRVTKINKQIKELKKAGAKPSDKRIKALLKEKKEFLDDPKKFYQTEMKKARAEQKVKDAERLKTNDPNAPWNEPLSPGDQLKYDKRRQRMEDTSTLKMAPNAQERTKQLYQQSSIKNQQREPAWKDKLRRTDQDKGNLSEQLDIAAKTEGQIEAHHINPRAKTYKLTKNLTDEQHFWVHNELEKRGVKIGNDPEQGVQLTRHVEHQGSPDTVHGKYKELLIDGSMSPAEILNDKQMKHLADFYDEVASGNISNPQDIVDIITMYNREYRRIVDEVVSKRQGRWPDLNTKRQQIARPTKVANPLKRPSK